MVEEGNQIKFLKINFSLQLSFVILEKHKKDAVTVSKQAYNYFRELHNSLHILEKEIQSNLKENKEILLNKTKTVLNSLKTGCEQINGKMSEIRCYIHCDVTNTKTVSQINQETKTFLDNVNCMAKFNGNDQEFFT